MLPRVLWSRLSVRARMTLWSAVLVTVALAVFGVGLLATTHRLLMRSVNDMLTRHMAQFEREVMAPNRPGPLLPPRLGEGGAEGPPAFEPPHPDRRGIWLPGDPIFPPQGREQGRPMGPPGGGPGPHRNGPPQGFPRRILDPNTGRPPGLRSDDSGEMSQPLSQHGFERARNGEATFDPGRWNGTPMQVFSRAIRRPDGATVILQVAEPTDSVDRAVGGLTQALLLMTPIALVLAAGGGALFAERSLRPVRQITWSASRIEAQNLSERLPVAGKDEFGQLAAILNSMLERLEAAFQRERRFAADASHELRTPLASIKAAAGLALEEAEEPGVPEDIRIALAEIDAGADRANRIIRDLLFLARAGTLPVRSELVEATRVVQAAVNAACSARITAATTDGDETAATATLPQVIVEVDPPSLLLNSDADHLQRLLINLIGNALRHTPAGGTVTVRATVAVGGRVVFSVRDTGEGIAPEHLARLGEAFYRPDPARSRRSGGNGLGLAICRSLAQALGGEMAIQSALGHGTTVTLTLPTNAPVSASLS